MKKLLIYFFVFLFSFSLALAVTVSTDKQEYTGQESVILTISECTGISVVKILNPSGTLVDIKGGSGDGVFTYNALSDSSDGKYQALAICTNGNSENLFCVDANGCLGSLAVGNTSAIGGVTDGSGSAGGSGGSGGGDLCDANWQCSGWSYCGSSFTQTRTCFDKNKCHPNREETQPCTECLESWVCSLWSECSKDKNYRTCEDEHFCNSNKLQPKLQKACTDADASGPAPSYISNDILPPYVAPPAAPTESFWQKNKTYLITIPLVLIAIVLVIFLSLHFLRPKKLAFNLNELKQWVSKERVMGTSDEDIRKILVDHTGWKKEEIDQAMGVSSPALDLTTKDLTTKSVKLKPAMGKPMSPKLAKTKPSMVKSSFSKPVMDKSAPVSKLAKSKPAMLKKVTKL